ncbi:MAG: hypothetical protein HY900_15215 [Deltaproteobacteria bacterium]|nr:hypothetical protein [Deltaproteobacteria bacterium]
MAAFVVGAKNWDLRKRAQIVAEVQGAAGDDIELHRFPASLLPTPPHASPARLFVSKGIPVH